MMKSNAPFLMEWIDVRMSSMQDYVTKPFNPEDLFLQLRKSISR
jgi:DNA-binding response OmpR family regulator